ncbi:hypothetical protein [Streptosporangium roseum]
MAAACRTRCSVTPYYSEAFLNPGLRAAVASGELTDATGGA